MKRVFTDLNIYSILHILSFHELNISNRLIFLKQYEKFYCENVKIIPMKKTDIFFKYGKSPFTRLFWAWKTCSIKICKEFEDSRELLMHIKKDASFFRQIIENCTKISYLFIYVIDSSYAFENVNGFRKLFPEICFKENLVENVKKYVSRGILYKTS